MWNLILHYKENNAGLNCGVLGNTEVKSKVSPEHEGRGITTNKPSAACTKPREAVS